MVSPGGSVFNALLRQMGQDNETAVFLDDTQRQAVSKPAFAACYHKEPPTKVVFDTRAA